MNLSVLLDFTNVVDPGKQLPLHIDFGSGANREVVQAFLDAEVGKDRLYHRQTPSVDLSASHRVDAGFHLLDPVRVGAVHLDG
jgi:hypothetical protein